MGKLTGPGALFATSANLIVCQGDLKNGTNLTDANQTIQPNTDAAARYNLAAATLTASRTKTLGVTGPPITGLVVRLVRYDVTANTMPVVNGGPAAGTVFTFPVSVAGMADFQWNGTDWIFVGFAYIGGGVAP